MKNLFTLITNIPRPIVIIFMILLAHYIVFEITLEILEISDKLRLGLKHKVSIPDVVGIGVKVLTLGTLCYIII